MKILVEEELTISAGLHARLNIPDALDRHSILIVPIDKLVLKLANLENEHTEFIGDVGNVLIAFFAPN